MTNSEFWRELKPIEQKFRPGALPEAYIANAPTEDERFYAPLPGEPNGTFDVFDYIALCRGHYEKNGIGADYIDQLFR